MTDKVFNFLLSPAIFVAYAVLGLVFLLSAVFFKGTACFADFLWITIGLMTGSGPFTFKDTISSPFLLWFLAWPLHISSWLVIPALVGMLISRAAEDIKKQQALTASVMDLLRDLGVPDDKLSQTTEEAVKEVHDRLKRSS